MYSDFSHKRWPSLFAIIISSVSAVLPVSSLMHRICQVLAFFNELRCTLHRIQLISPGGKKNKPQNLVKNVLPYTLEK